MRVAVGVALGAVIGVASLVAPATPIGADEPAGAAVGAPPRVSKPWPCRNEREMWLDEYRIVQVADDAPDWFLQEILNESSDYRRGFEGRGDVDEDDPEESFSDRTKNLNAQGCSLALSKQDSRTCEEIPPDEDVGTIIPDDCWGTYPTDRYDVAWDSGSHLSSGGWADRVTGWVALLLFGFGKLAVQAALWLVAFAFGFDIAGFRETVADFASRIDRRLVHVAGHDLNLVTVAWFALVSVAGFAALRGRMGRAGAEILMSVVLAALAWVVLGPLTQPVPAGGTDAPAYAAGGYLDSAADLVGQTSVAPLLAAHDRSPNEELESDELTELLRETQGGLHREFVEAPYDYINWGTETFSREPEPGETQSCREVHDNVLTVVDKPESWPSRYMARHGCIEEGAFNSKMTPTRLASVALVMLVALFVAVTLGFAAASLLMAKFLVALLFVALPLAAVAALLPGRGRRMAWWWLGSLLQLWLASLAVGLVVMLLLLAMDILRRVTGFLELHQRWIVILGAVAVVYLLRKRLASAGRNLGRGFAAGLGGLTEAASGQVWRRPSGNVAWAGAPAGGGGLDRIDGPSPGDLGAGSPRGGGHLGGSMAGSRAGRVSGRPATGGAGAGLDLFDLEPEVPAGRAATVAAGAGLVAGRLGARSVAFTGRMGSSLLGAVYRKARRLRMENRRQLKGGAMRAALNDFEEYVDLTRAAGKPQYATAPERTSGGVGFGDLLPGRAGRNPLRNFPTPDQVTMGTWRLNLHHAMRKVKRGEFGVYADSGRNVRFRYSGNFRKPSRIRERDGQWRRVRVPPRPPTPGWLRDRGREHHEWRIRAHQRDIRDRGGP